MKYMIALLIAAVLLFVGCVYESPLTTEHNIAIDPTVPGLWEPIQDKGDVPNQDEQLMILKYSDTEYLIHYPPGGNDEAYYRGYPIKIGGVSCVQLQIIGTADGPLAKDRKDLFHVVSYQLTGSGLEIKMLNTDLVNDKLKTTDELRKAFLKNINNKGLFTDAVVFRKIKN